MWTLDWLVCAWKAGLLEGGLLSPGVHQAPDARESGFCKLENTVNMKD